MGFWPFGGGKRQRAGESEDHGRETLLRRAPSVARANQEKVVETASQSTSTEIKNRQEEKKGRRLSKARTSSSQAVDYAQPSSSRAAPIRSTEDVQHTSHANSPYNEKRVYQQNLMSQTSIGPENFTVTQGPPTLHAKRAEQDPHLPRRKSSKRKAEDSAREREIRAMASSPIPIPKRPATIYGSSPLQRDSRQIPGPLNRRLERPTSEVSLPTPGSLPDVSDFASQNSFKIGMLAALSPRPTIRYDANPKTAQGKPPNRQGMAIRQAIAEEDVSDKKRINELADDLDAGGLRELMERDRRRKERKKEADKAKLQRRLQRRAERQREEEARRARTEAFVRSSPANNPRSPGVTLDSSPSQQDSERRPADGYEGDPFSDPVFVTSAPQLIRNPFEDEKEMDFMKDQLNSDDELGDNEAPPVPVRSPQRQIETQEYRPRQKPSQSTLSPPVSPVNRAVDRTSLSQASLTNRELTPDIPESSSLERRASDQSSLRLSSWTTFFKRGTRRKFAGPSQGRTTPSEFSNTSRESVSRKQPPPPPLAANRTFRRSDSATPQRTLSRFREDLPELPISPPDSRIQSPEASGPSAGNALSTDTEIDVAPSFLNISSARNSIGQQLAEQLDRGPPKRSVDYDVPMSAPEMIVSQSLASVDSEGSWLSGKPSKRLSGQKGYALKPSQSSLPRHIPGAFDDGSDHLMYADDENRPNLVPPPATRPGEPSATGDSQPDMTGVTNEKRSQIDTTTILSGKDDERRHAGMARQPTLISQSRHTMSQEGLLEQFASMDQGNTSTTGAEEEDEESDSDSPDAEARETSILRAKSVEYKKGHVRHFSAGSAKILDVQRYSVQSDIGRPTTGPRGSELSLQAEGSSKAAQL